jgi:hypothetical protein
MFAIVAGVPVCYFQQPNQTVAVSSLLSSQFCKKCYVYIVDDLQCVHFRDWKCFLSASKKPENE